MYDLGIIGSGPAGLEASLYARKNNLSCALIEKDLLGGLCFNRGCIPTKLYIHRLKQARKCGKALSLKELYAEKERFLSSWREVLFKFLRQQKVDVFFSQAKILDNHTLELKDGKKLEARYILVCTGSIPRPLPHIERKFYFPEDIFSLESIGDNILIIGAGATGLEIATILTLLGKRVTVIEKEPQILPGIDNSVARRIAVFLRKRGMNIITSHSLKAEKLKSYDDIFLCTGRIPQRIGAEEFLEAGNIFLCGDAKGDNFFAYTASWEARFVIDRILGKEPRNIANRLYSVFLELPLSWTKSDYAGECEQKTIPLSSNPLSFFYDSHEGFIKLKIDSRTHRLKEGYVFSEFSWEIIHFLSLVVSLELELNFFKDFLFFHPSFSESLKVLGD